MPFILGLFAGVGAILLGVVIRKRSAALEQACTAQTSGTVVRYKEEYIEENPEVHGKELTDDLERAEVTTMYYPVFEYTAEGQTITKTGHAGSNRPKYQVGGQVHVFYNPNQPDMSYIAEEKASNNLGIILIVSGPVIILLGLVFTFLG